YTTNGVHLNFHLSRLFLMGASPFSPPMCVHAQMTTQRTSVTGKQPLSWFFLLAGRNISSCWEHANCNTDYIGKHFSSGTFKFRCCSRDLCNSSPVTTGSKIILGIASLLIIIQLVYF
uniref:UPAR/Ly6 domain-containing protein n=1 Tax=Varanus komodoensis TaxID=61221 RepID=A0A8D2L5T3_VARKO